MKRRLSGLAVAAVLVTSILLAGTMHSSYALPSLSLAGKHKAADQHVENEGTASIDSVKLYLKNNNEKSNIGDLTVQLVKDGEAVAAAKVSATTDLSKKMTELVADFDAEITGDYDIVVTSEGKGSVKLLKEKSVTGNLYAAAKDGNKWDLKYELAANAVDDDDGKEQEPEPVPSSTAGAITVYAYRIASEHWGPTFTGAKMFFVLYNSTGKIVKSGFADENGYEVTGLDAGEQYYVYPTDCDSCHGSDHDVVFHHWEDGSTERPRPVNAGASVGAYYEFVPHTAS